MKKLETLTNGGKEENRLARVKYYNILDTKPEEKFDNLTDVVAEILDVPICLVTIIDEDRIWFKSKHGVDANYVPREGSFCQCTLETENLVEIENAEKDERFCTNPLVTQGPYIKFYAGVPLVDHKDNVLGTFCVLDNKPRKLDAKKRKILGNIAKTVVSLIVLRREKQEAEKLALVRDEFLSNMSHEIRTPLNAIIGFNDLLLKTNLTPEQRQYQDITYQASQNLKILVNDILDVSKLESGKITLEKRPVCLTDLKDQLVQLQQRSASDKGLRFNAYLDPEIPLYIEADATRLTQILINLLSNAIKFTHEGHVQLKIFLLSKDHQKAKIRFSVTDTGIGIDQGKRDQIFERFVQADNSVTRLYGGSGLGLNIVRKLVDLHKGRIWVESQINEGTSFFVDLEFTISETKREPGNNPNINEEMLPDLKGMNILLAEDNKFNQILGEKYLKRFHANVDIAENGLLVLEMINAKKYDVILMDLQMPKMDGYACTRFIRTNLKSAIPIIACSAHTMADEKKKCFDIGMSDFLSKPYSLTEFVKTVAKYNLTNLQNNARMKSIADTFKELTAKEGVSFVLEIKEIFLETIPLALEEFNTYIRDNDFKGISSSAHFFRGSLGSLGFAEGMQLCIQIESCIKSELYDKTMDLSSKLVHYIEDILEFITASQN